MQSVSGTQMLIWLSTALQFTLCKLRAPTFSSRRAANFHRKKIHFRCESVRECSMITAVTRVLHSLSNSCRGGFITLRRESHSSLIKCIHAYACYLHKGEPRRYLHLIMSRTSCGSFQGERARYFE